MMGMMTFINLPVKDLGRSTEFFTGLGFKFDEAFTDENATRVIISDEASVMLVVEPFFQGFSGKAVADTSSSSEVIVGLSAESKEHVDELAAKVVAAGGTLLGEALDDGFMYMRGFQDPDGHQWSFIHMDMSAIPEE
jgi:predicted lactoylglutathione lyase